MKLAEMGPLCQALPNPKYLSPGNNCGVSNLTGQLVPDVLLPFPSVLEAVKPTTRWKVGFK